MFHTKRVKNEMEISIHIFPLINYKNYKINNLIILRYKSEQ